MRHRRGGAGIKPRWKAWATGWVNLLLLTRHAELRPRGLFANRWNTDPERGTLGSSTRAPTYFRFAGLSGPRDATCKAVLRKTVPKLVAARVKHEAYQRQ